jgi:hypothetical protein
MVPRRRASKRAKSAEYWTIEEQLMLEATAAHERRATSARMEHKRRIILTQDEIILTQDEIILTKLLQNHLSTSKMPTKRRASLSEHYSSKRAKPKLGWSSQDEIILTQDEIILTKLLQNHLNANKMPPQRRASLSDQGSSKRARPKLGWSTQDQTILEATAVQEITLWKRFHRRFNDTPSNRL